MKLNSFFAGILLIIAITDSATGMETAAQKKASTNQYNLLPCLTWTNLSVNRCSGCSLCVAPGYTGLGVQHKSQPSLLINASLRHPILIGTRGFAVSNI